VQARWSAVAIEQHGDAGVAMAHVDNNAKLASQTWAPNGSKFADLKAGADGNSICFAICFAIHGLAPPIILYRKLLLQNQPFA
jgi:hypothetical protein